MNGLKYIRSRCNYSQRALAEALGVSRQAINMWENSKKSIPKERQNEICILFGLNDVSLLGEISDEMVNQLEQMPIYRIMYNEQVERFAFKPIESDDFKFQTAHYTSLLTRDMLILDDKCSLKRAALKTLFEEITIFSEVCKTHNSYDNLSLLNRIINTFGNTFDLYKECFDKPNAHRMVYYDVLLAVLDALNISFGLTTKEDLLNMHIDFVGERSKALYDYRKFSVNLSDEITNQLEKICSQIPIKRKKSSKN